MSIDEFRAIGRESIPIKVLIQPCLSFPIAIERASLSAPQKQAKARKAVERPNESDLHGLYHDFLKENAHKESGTVAKGSRKTRTKADGITAGPLANFIRKEAPAAVSAAKVHEKPASPSCIAEPAADMEVDAEVTKVVGGSFGFD